MSKVMTLEQLLSKAPTDRLLVMYEELTTNIIPNTCECKETVSRVNRLIDQGRMCINESNYRHVYVPSFQKALFREMANRFAYEHAYSIDTLSNTEVTDRFDDVQFDDFLKGGDD